MEEKNKRRREESGSRIAKCIREERYRLHIFDEGAEEEEEEIVPTEKKDELELTPPQFSFPNRKGTLRTVFVVEHDVPLDEKSYVGYVKRKKASRHLAEKAEQAGLTALIGRTDPTGALIRWSPQLSQNLSWWLDAKSFEGFIDPDEICEAMIVACRNWMSVCGVRFRKVSAEEDALFVVRFTDTSQNTALAHTFAMSFFPDAAPEERILHVFSHFLSEPEMTVGILRHELGHILGFRHEHIRLGDCLPERWREGTTGTIPLTVYDSTSVMHYDFRDMGLGGSSQLQITHLDAIGAQQYYGGPMSRFKVVEK